MWPGDLSSRIAVPRSFRVTLPESGSIVAGSANNGRSRRFSAPSSASGKYPPPEGNKFPRAIWPMAGETKIKPLTYGRDESYNRLNERPRRGGHAPQIAPAPPPSPRTAADSSSPPDSIDPFAPSPPPPPTLFFPPPNEGLLGAGEFYAVRRSCGGIFINEANEDKAIKACPRLSPIARDCVSRR
jgi:hypothetical protein